MKNNKWFELKDIELDSGKIVVVTGFQGVNENGDITTLGRGGSDTTAVAISAALGAKNCYIFSDNPFGLKHQMAHRKYRRFFVIRFAVSPKDTIFALYSHTFWQHQTVMTVSDLFPSQMKSVRTVGCINSV